MEYLPEGSDVANSLKVSHLVTGPRMSAFKRKIPDYYCRLIIIIIIIRMNVIATL